MHDAEIRVHTVVDTDEFSKLDKSMTKVKSLLGNVSSKMKEFGAKITTTMKQAVGGVKDFALAFVGASAKAMLLVAGLKGVQASSKAVAEGLKNLAQASPEYNKAMSDFKSSLEQLKNALASAFEPIITAVLPYLTTFVNWLVKVMDYLGQFFAVLNGRTSYYKAKKQNIDYAKSLKTVAENTKEVAEAQDEANKGLASFDKLNNLSTNTTQATDTSGGGGGVSGGGALVGADAFEKTDIDMSKFEWLTKLMDKFDKLKAKASEVWDKIKEKATPIWNKIKEKASPVLDKIKEKFQQLIEWGKANFPVFWDKFKDKMAEVAERTKTKFAEIKAKLAEFDEKFRDVISRFAYRVADFGDKVKDVKEKIMKWFENVKEQGIGGLVASAKTKFLSLYTTVKTKVIDALTNAFENFKKKITTLFSSIVTTVSNFIGSAISKVINTLFEKIEGFVNWVVDKVNSIIGIVNKFNPGEDIKTLEHIELPRLATGGVVTSPTRALIGEEGREVVLPLDTNTEWMDILADKLASSVTFQVVGDPNGMFHVMQVKSKEYNRMTGRPSFS